MKRILLAATMIVAALTLSSCFTPENKIKVISYNIRLSGLGHARGADGIHYWDNRRHASINMINDEKPAPTRLIFWWRTCHSMTISA